MPFDPQKPMPMGERLQVEKRNTPLPQPGYDWGHGAAALTKKGPTGVGYGARTARFRLDGIIMDVAWTMNDM